MIRMGFHDIDTRRSNLRHDNWKSFIIASSAGSYEEYNRNTQMCSHEKIETME